MLNTQCCWWVFWSVTCILNLFKYCVCSCLKGKKVWTKTDIKTKAQRVCRLKLELLFFWTSAQIWIHLLEMEYLVFNSACELVMLEFKAWFISFCTCFCFNTDSIQERLLLHGSFLPSWKSGLILSRETFLKFTFVTLQPLKMQKLFFFFFFEYVVFFPGLQHWPTYLILRPAAGCVVALQNLVSIKQGAVLPLARGARWAGSEENWT